MNLFIKNRIKNTIKTWGGSKVTFLSYSHLSHDMCTGLLTPMLPFIRPDLDINYLQSGLLISAYTVTSGAAHFLGGWLGDRLNRAVLMVIGLVGTSLFSIAVALSPSYETMLVMLIMMGICSGTFHPAATTVLAGVIGKGEKGKATALYMVGGSSGFAIGPIIGGLVASAIGWRWVFFILAIPGLLAVPFVLKNYLRYGRISVKSTKDSADITTRIKTSFWQAIKPTLLVMIVVVLTQLLAGCAVGFIALFVEARYNVEKVFAATFVGFIRAGGIAGTIIGGWLADKWGKKKSIVLSLVVIGPVFFLLTIVPNNWSLNVVAVLFGMVSFMRGAPMLAFLIENTPPRYLGTVMGIFFGVGMEGQSLIQPIVGDLADMYGMVPIYKAIAYIAIGLSAISFFLIGRPRLKQKR